MKRVEPTETEPRSSSFNFICFSQLACCYFPHYTKASERGRGEIRLLTTPRLTLHKIIHHDASPAAEQSHENSHLLQLFQRSWHFSSLKRKREDSCCKRRKPKGLLTSPLLLFPKSSFQPDLNESAVHRHWACWGPTMRPEGRVVRTEQTGKHSWAECVYSTSFSDATTLLIAEKKMTSLMRPGARAVALWRGLPVPVCLLAHWEHSGSGHQIPLLSKLL